MVPIKNPINYKIPNLKMIVTKMKSQSELNADNVTVDPYPVAQQKQHTGTLYIYIYIYIYI